MLDTNVLGSALISSPTPTKILYELVLTIKQSSDANKLLEDVQRIVAEAGQERNGYQIMLPGLRKRY